MDILSSPLFLVNNWSGACQSPGIWPHSSSWRKGWGRVDGVWGVGPSGLGRETRWAGEGWLESTLREKTLSSTPYPCLPLVSSDLEGTCPGEESPSSRSHTGIMRETEGIVNWLNSAKKGKDENFPGYKYFSRTSFNNFWIDDYQDET